MIVRAWLARHGETEWNRQGRRQGQLDSPLTAEGVGQAGWIAARMACEPIDAIFASPQGRAMATAGSIAAVLGLRVRPLDELCEVDHGQVAGLTDAEIERAFPGLLERRARDKYRCRFPDGESYADADARAAAAIATMAAAGATRPLVISHEMIGRMLVGNLLDLTPSEALALRHSHGTIWQVDPGQDRIVQLSAAWDGRELHDRQDLSRWPAPAAGRRRR